MSRLFPANSWFVGCGNMGGAMVEGWRKAGTDLSGLTVFSPSGRTIEGVSVRSKLPDRDISHCWLGHKPHQVEDVASRLGSVVGDRTIVLSILAGVECVSLRRLFPDARSIVRLMPNLPVSEGEGVVGLYSDDADEQVRETVDAYVAPLGVGIWGEREDDLTAISAVAGSGPAYVARFAAAMIEEAERLGLSPGLARRAALQTIGGTGRMALASGEPLDELACRVASPGGSTQAGLDVLDHDSALFDLVRRTVEAARCRTEEMAAAARG
ncbi:pyrroline-5-carboxylate reductase dimerization domain-containing protein [Sphingomicrobium sp. XHP0239]|uniref:pyrroline-5-carboxylate reductase family protein n=1 Tax=Sphingomicrobium maritimum TaxID=3133972 RepID=UPI0031CCBC85